MQKEDIQWAVLGILMLLVIALVIKPIATGQPVNIGFPEKATPTPTSTPQQTLLSVSITITPTQGITTSTSSPTPTSTWDQQVQSVMFVDPSTYGLNLNQSLPNSTRFPTDYAAIPNDTMTTYAKFSGQYSGTTQVITIPFPYWEMWYTVEPRTTNLIEQSEPSGKYVVTPTQGEGASKSGYTGSISTAMPKFSIQVMDAEDPNRIARSITPYGTLDPDLWTGDDDPRPWKEKFFEGQRSYYFIITASLLKSYAIDIKVPSSYIGKY
jgi:hypothetical protein